ncbi:MAG TPA: magnesium transporter CorA family protein [Clostridia bacterium]
MVRYFYTPAGEKNAHEIDSARPNCWIHMENPSDLEIENVSKITGVSPQMFKAALDEEERAHIEIEDQNRLILVDIPYMYEAEDGESYVYNTLPLGIIMTPDHFITVCLKSTSIINEFIHGIVKGFDINKPTRFLYQILYHNSVKFLHYLRQIDKLSSRIQVKLHKSMKNKELIQLLELEKSLVYFSTSIKSNHAVLEKVLASSIVKHYDEDQDILDDAVVESRQAMEMADIYREVLGNTMDAYASVIGNNQNKVMKLLTALTIILTIPSLIASFFGMNLILPLETSKFGFWVVLAISAILSGIAAWIMYRKKMF